MQSVFGEFLQPIVCVLEELALPVVSFDGPIPILSIPTIGTNISGPFLRYRNLRDMAGTSWLAPDALFLPARELRLPGGYRSNGLLLATARASPIRLCYVRSMIYPAPEI